MCLVLKRVYNMASSMQQKKVVLTVEKKLEVISLLQKGTSYTNTYL